MAKVNWPMLSLSAKGKVTCPVDSSDAVYDPIRKRWIWDFHPEKFVGLETGDELLQENEKRLELEWNFKAIYCEFPTKNGRIHVRKSYYKPTGEPNEGQLRTQANFRAAVLAWQVLPFEQQIVYNKLKEPLHMSGYNRFLRQYLKGEI